MAVIVTANLTQINTCDAITGWSGGAVDTDVEREGTGCLAAKVSAALSSFDYTGAPLPVNLSNGEHIYVWMQCTTPGILDTQALGGIRIRARTSAGGLGTNQWFVGGGDAYPGGWVKFVVDPASAPDVGTTFTSTELASIDLIGVALKTTAMVAGPINNFFWDIVHTGTGLTITGGTDADPGTFSQIETEDQSSAAGKAFGIIRKIDGIFYVQGRLIFGDDPGTSSTVFKDSGQVLVFPNRKVASALYEIRVVGNATGTNKFELGTVVGTGDDRQGVAGGTIQAISPQRVKFDSETDSAHINVMNLYGVTFKRGAIIQMAGSTTQDAIGCIFDSCDEVQPNNAEFLNNTIIGPPATDNALEMTVSHQIKRINFIAETGGATEHHLHIPAVGTYTADALKFFGFAPDGAPDWHGKNDSGGAVTINATNGSTIAQAEVENVGGGSSTTVINTKTLTVTVKDSSNSPIQNAQVWIQKDSADTDFGHEAKPFTSAAGNNAGDADFVVSEAIPADLPSSGFLSIRSASGEHTYRYASKSGSTFTFNAQVTGTDDGTGNTTTINETGIGAKNIVEGDTIANTTETPDQFAVVLSVSANSVTTTTLSGGASWAGDSYSVHRLAINYSTSDKATVSLMNEETNASGVATESYNFGSSKAVIIRIRKATAGTKYIPFSTTGTITGDFNLEATLTTDTIA